MAWTLQWLQALSCLHSHPCWQLAPWGEIYSRPSSLLMRLWLVSRRLKEASARCPCGDGDDAYQIRKGGGALGEHIPCAVCSWWRTRWQIRKGIDVAACDEASGGYGRRGALESLPRRAHVLGSATS